MPIFPHDPYRLTTAGIVQCREKRSEGFPEERPLPLWPAARERWQDNAGSNWMGVSHR
jgi:hypothetical protein